MSSDSSAQWICASCGARHDSHNPPCTSCAGEEFARLESSKTERIEESTQVAWICEGCGTRSPRNNTACRECGSFDYAQLADGQASTDNPRNFVEPGEAPGATDSGRDTQYYIGVLVGVVGVVVIPYVLFLLALPESAASLWGRSTLDLLGEDARSNPFMRGSFLIIRWYGHLLWFALIGAFILGFLWAL